MATEKILFDDKDWVNRSEYLLNLIGKHFQHDINNVPYFTFGSDGAKWTSSDFKATVSANSLICNVLIENQKVFFTLDPMAKIGLKWFDYDETIKLGGVLA